MIIKFISLLGMHYHIVLYLYPTLSLESESDFEPSPGNSGSLGGETSSIT